MRLAVLCKIGSHLFIARYLFLVFLFSILALTFWSMNNVSLFILLSHLLSFPSFYLSFLTQGRLDVSSGVCSKSYNPPSQFFFRR